MGLRKKIFITLKTVHCANYKEKTDMRTVVLYIAISLDGYIADVNGGVDWLDAQQEQTEETKSYDAFIKDVDTVLMGWNTYHQVTTELSPTQWVYAGLTSYVITHRKLSATDNIFFTDENPCTLVKRLAQERGKAIWICGGAKIAQQLMRENLIDRYHICVIPTVLGNGIPLFAPTEHRIGLRLVNMWSENGITELVYERR